MTQRSSIGFPESQGKLDPFDRNPIVIIETKCPPASSHLLASLLTHGRIPASMVRDNDPIGTDQFLQLGSQKSLEFAPERFAIFQLAYLIASAF